MLQPIVVNLVVSQAVDVDLDSSNGVVYPIVVDLSESQSICLDITTGLPLNVDIGINQPIDLDLSMWYGNSGDGAMTGLFQTISTGGNSFSIFPETFIAGSSFLLINGLYQQWGIDYTENSNLAGFTTTVNVPNGYAVEFRYAPSQII